MKTINVPFWKIESYGVIPRSNAAWLSLQSLTIRREGTYIQVSPEEMRVGEIAEGIFRSGTKCTVERVEDSEIEFLRKFESCK